MPPGKETIYTEREIAATQVHFKLCFKYFHYCHAELIHLIHLKILRSYWKARLHRDCAYGQCLCARCMEVLTASPNLGSRISARFREPRPE